MTALTWTAATDRPDLLAPPVREALSRLPDPGLFGVTEIDPDVADTQALVDSSDIALEDCANCIVVAGRRGQDERVAAVLVLATTRADVNTTVRKALDVRKASFMATDRAVEETGMEYGGITLLGLPPVWPVLVDERVLARPRVVIGSGVRRSKLRLPGSAVEGLPGVRVVPGLAR